MIVAVNPARCEFKRDKAGSHARSKLVVVPRDLSYAPADRKGSPS